MSRILFLTSTNLAANPRLVKELRLAYNNGFHCTVLQFSLGNWSDAVTEDLKKTFSSAHFITLSAKRYPFFLWVMSSLLEKFLRCIPLTLISGYLLSIASNKRSMLLISKLKQLIGGFDWVIAHNPAAFYPALVFSIDRKARLGIDIEDYHPGESSNLRTNLRMKKLMRGVLPHATYLSFASQSIMREVNQDIDLSFTSQMCLINSFNKEEFHFKLEHKDGPLRLIWFSQYINKGRGLESILHVIDLIEDIELHLIGNLNHSFYLEFIKDKANVHCHDVISQSVLHKKLGSFDIGLAIEPGKDLNNNLAISNKMIAYAQAGLFILSSKTPAQDDFLNHSNLDFLQSDLNNEDIYNALLSLVKSKDEIRRLRNPRFLNGLIYDWDIVSNQLLKKWTS